MAAGSRSGRLLAATLLAAAPLGGHAIEILHAPGRASALPVVSIVIDDVGNVRQEGLQAVELPGPLTYAMLPHTPHAASLARIAHSLGKEVLVHLPMEARRRRTLGPGGLTSVMDRLQFEQRVHAALASVPHAIGVSNHMGSLLTTLREPMDWLMDILATRPGWLFLDSRTTSDSVAEARARAANVETTWRDVFLDNEPDEDAVRAQLERLFANARRSGSAVAIGHPYPQTLKVLAETLPTLRAAGVRLVALSRMVAVRETARGIRLRMAQSPPPGHAASTR